MQLILTINHFVIFYPDQYNRMSFIINCVNYPIAMSDFICIYFH